MTHRDKLISVFGEPIYHYTRQDAIDDEVLVDLSTIFPEEARLYKYPVACTSTVWAIIEKAYNNPRACNDMKGLVWDLLWMSQHHHIKRYDSSTYLFKVKIIGAGRKQIFTFKVICGPGDNSEPVITITLPEED